MLPRYEQAAKDARDAAARAGGFATAAASGRGGEIEADPKVRAAAADLAAADAAYQRAIDKRVAAVQRLTASRDNGLPEDPADRAAYNAAHAEEETTERAWVGTINPVERAHARLTAADAAAAQAAYDAAHQEEENTRAEYDAAKAADDAAQAAVRDAKDKYDQARVEAAADGANKAADAAFQAAGAIPGCRQVVRVQDPIQTTRDILGAGKMPTGGHS